MKKLVQIVIALQFALMLTHCATSTDDLYRTYAVCREQTLHVKVSETGVVIVHSDGSPVMVYKTGACPDEMAAWEKAHAMREKRRREREAYQAAVSACGRETMWCTGRGGVSNCISNSGRLNTNCTCSCIDRDTLRDILNRSGY